ncbi:probable pectinesterase/pectinesterase inhibitor 21 [Argentina anserina]|uniref:probable pectinesterase/pectinesterase inhibitor 21 n=1 Tax=Argentina anserina TaxID=57926 RepID=UPI0021767E61|nr:probable pectinesterase/pectinesterase inhibitor 21 [Potentilla anserina]
MNGNNRHAKKKKIAIIGVSALILVAMVVAVAVGVTRGQKGGKDEKKPATTSKAIETVCQPTDYKETCQNMLSEKASNVTDPKELIKVGFQIAMEKLQEVINNSDTLKELAKDDMGNQALQNCKELIQYSIDDLKRSADQIGPFEVTKLKEYVEDLKIWLSASINYEQTCLDGFDNTAGEAGAKMKDFLKTSQELTKNGLAMTSEISNLFGNSNIKNQRRLLANANTDAKKVPKIIPAWIETRRLDIATANPISLKPDIIVAKDGSGKYKTVNEALKDIPKNNAVKTFVIYIKQGVYNEQVVLDKYMTNVMFIGDGPTKTKITGNKNFADGVQTFKTATVAVVGDYFIAKDIGFENTAGARGHQAVALRVQSDLSIFYNCQIDGYQDTLYTQTHRQFYRDCTISGTIDFIFGDAAVVFQNCKMIIRKPDPNQSCMVTAQGRIDKREPTGIVIQNCTISGEKDYILSGNTKIGYLGRPWKPFSRTIIMQSQIDDVINPMGWTEWTGSTNHETSWFGEFSNRGLGAATNLRVKWYKLATPEDAGAFTAGNILSGDRWIKPSGVPYVAGMMRI